MSPTEILAYLSILDNELSKIQTEKEVLKKEQETLRVRALGDEKKLLVLQKTLENAEKDVKDTLALVKNEQSQFSQRERQLMEMGGIKSAKHLGSENDRATLVIHDLEQKLIQFKEKQSHSETEYLKFEELMGIAKKQGDLRAAEIVSRLIQLEVRKNGLEKERMPKVELLPKEIGPTYDKLRVKYPDPVTTIDDGSCNTCYTSIPLRMSNAVRAGEPQVCPGCHRYLVPSLVIAPQNESPELI